MGEPKNDFMTAIQMLVEQKTLSKITVDELCLKTGYSRQTFYRNFSDKFELAFAVYKQDYEKALEGLVEPWSFDDICRTMIQCFLLRRDFYRKMFRSSQATYSFRDQFVDYSYGFTVEAIGKKKISKDQQTLIRYWTSNSVSLTEQCVLSPRDIDEDWLIKMFKRLMPEEVKYLYLS